MQPVTTGEYLEAMQYACCSYHHSEEYTRKIKWIIKRYKLKRNNVYRNAKKREALNLKFKLNDSDITRMAKLWRTELGHNKNGYTYNEHRVLQDFIQYGEFTFNDWELKAPFIERIKEEFPTVYSEIKNPN